MSGLQGPREDGPSRRTASSITAVAGNQSLSKGGEPSSPEGRGHASHHVGVYCEDLLDPFCHRVTQALDGMKTSLNGPTGSALSGMYSYEDLMHVYRNMRDCILMAMDDFLIGVSLRHRIAHDSSSGEHVGAGGVYPGSPMGSREVPQLPLEHYLDLKLEAAVGEQVRVGSHLYPETPVGSQQRQQQDVNMKGSMGARQENTGVDSQQASDAPLRYGCEHCGKRFATSSDLARHSQEHHSTERPYVCTVCAKSFKKRCHLDRHSILHTGERQYTCDICRNTFARSDILDRHRRTHVGVKPHRCDICGHGCRDGYSLALHLKTHNRESLSPCMTCGKMFRNSCLMRHNSTCRPQAPMPED